MSTRLKNLVTFTAVPVGVPTTLPHGLTIPGKGSIRPDYITVLGPNAGQFPRVTITSTDTDVTVVNVGPGVSDVQLLVEWWHSFERAFGGTPNVDLQATSIVLNPADGAAGGASDKNGVRLATTEVAGNVPLAGLAAIDGVVPVAGNRILVKNQTVGAANGIYLAAAGAWQRSPDADTSAEVLTGLTVWVAEGATQAQTRWTLQTPAPITLGVTTLTFKEESPYRSTTTLFYVLPGVAKATEIQALITKCRALYLADGLKRRIQLLPGDYHWDAIVDLSGLFATNDEETWLSIEGLGQFTRIIPDYSGPADDPANCFFKLWGVLDLATMNTSLAVAADRGQFHWNVVASGAMTGGSGKYALVTGYNQTAEQSFDDSDGTDVILKEIRRVTSVAANVLTLQRASAQYHVSGVPVTVQAILPASGIRIAHMYFDATGQVVATCVSMKFATSIEIENIYGKEITRTMAYGEGSNWIHGSGLYAISGVNGIAHVDSTCESDFKTIRVLGAGGNAVAAGAIPRLATWTRVRCSDVSFTDVEVHNMSGAAEQWGGVNCQWTNIRAYDCNCDASIVARTNMVIPESQGICAIVWSGGASPLNYAEFSHGTKVNGLKGSNCITSRNDFSVMYWFYHDTHDGQFVDVSVVNAGGITDGLTPGTFYVRGGEGHDSSGSIGPYMCRGTMFPLRINGTGFGGEISSYSFDAVGGTLSGYGVPLSMFNSAARLVIRDVNFSNNNEFFRYGGPFDPTANLTLVEIDNLQPGGPANNYFSHVELVFNPSVVDNMINGDLVEIDGVNSTAFVTWVKKCAGPTTKPVVICIGGYLDFGLAAYMLGAMGPQNNCTVLLDAAANAGDAFEGQAALPAHVNVASVVPAGRVKKKIAGAGYALCQLGAITERVPLTPLVAQVSTHELTNGDHAFHDLTLAGGPNTDGVGVTVPAPGGTGMDLVIRFAATLDNTNAPAYTTAQILVGGGVVALSPQAATSPAVGFPHALMIETKVHIAAGAAIQVKVQWKANVGTSSIDPATTFEGGTLTVERYPS